MYRSTAIVFLFLIFAGVAPAMAKEHSAKRISDKHSAKTASGHKSKNHEEEVSHHGKREAREAKEYEKHAKRHENKREAKVAVAHGRHHVVIEHVAYIPPAPAIPSVGDQEGLNQTHEDLDLKSNVALVLDQTSSEVLLDKNSSVALPIASITKLMTSLVVVEARQDMDEILEITDEDVDREKNSSSRLRPGVRLSRRDMLHIALMSSENRAASALGRNYPGGLAAAVAAMNAKARALGMTDTHYVEPTGLSSQNVASARDLARLVAAAQKQPLLCQFSTDSDYVIDANGRELKYSNSNHLVSNPDWDIMLQKTGYINEAGHCMVMRAMIDGRAIIMVFLDSKGKNSRLADAGRIRKWLEAVKLPNILHMGGGQQDTM